MTWRQAPGVPIWRADLAAAVRDALSGVSVNMNQRKVGELVSDWQGRSGKAWGV